MKYKKTYFQEFLLWLFMFYIASDDSGKEMKNKKKTLILHECLHIPLKYPSILSRYLETKTGEGNFAFSLLRISLMVDHKFSPGFEP